MMMIVLMIAQNDAPKWNALQRIPKRSSSDLNRSHDASCVKPDSSGFTQIPKINAFPSRNKRRFNSKINTVCLAIWWQCCRKVIDDCVSEFKWIEKVSLEMDACVYLVNRGDFRPWQGKLNTCGAFCTWMTPCAWRRRGEKRQTSTEYQFNQLSGGEANNMLAPKCTDRQTPPWPFVVDRNCVSFLVAIGRLAHQSAWNMSNAVKISAAEFQYENLIRNSPLKIHSSMPFVVLTTRNCGLCD